MDTTNLQNWLPFTGFVTLDRCGGVWNTNGSPSIVNNSLYLNGSSYLKRDNNFSFSGQAFSVSTIFSATSNTTGKSVCIWQFHNSTNRNFQLSITADGKLSLHAVRSSVYDFSITTSETVLDGNFHHAECTHDNSVWYLFFDGKLVGTKNFAFTSTESMQFLIGYNISKKAFFDGYVMQFMFFDGTALHTAEFTPPTADDYDLLAFELGFDFDTCRKLKNNISTDFDTERKLRQRWRYENYGTADLLSVAGYTVDLDAAKYNSAFYQTARTKCFDIPATDEIWVKFDVYSRNYSTRWRAYNGNDSSDVYGVCSTSTDIVFWSPSKVYTNSSVLLTGELQTVLLHMISDSSSGVIEAWLDGNKLYTYTGNVNHGANFENIYLQSDGSATVFSNVIISNTQIGFNENTKVNLDVQFDLLRRVVVSLDFTEDFDTERKIVNAVDSVFDTKLKIVRSVDFDADTFRKIIRNVIFNCDIIRKIPHKLILSPAENLVVNPAVDNSNGIQSVSIAIAAQQLTDQLTFVTINPVDIMQQIQGQILDYVFNLRVESTSQSGILTTCQCCSDIDNLLYTQIAYTLEKITWNDGVYVKNKTTGETTMIEKPKAAAVSHAFKIAALLRKVPIFLFDNFTSTVDIEQEGVTYQDLISEIFGWTSRIPHKLINVFIRNNQLWFVQRGHEQNTYNIRTDLTEYQIANLVIKKELVRTSYGVTQNSESLEKNATHGYWKPVLGQEIPEEGEEEEEEPTEESRVLPKHVSTTQGEIVTDVYYEYDHDGNVIRTRTTTSDRKTGQNYNQVIVENEYSTIHGEKVLVNERTTTYENYVFVDSKTVHHEYLTQGQQHVLRTSDDGSVTSSAIAASRQSDKPTPLDWKNQSTFGVNVYYVEENGRIFAGGWDNFREAVYTYQDGKKIEVVGWIWTSTDAKGNEINGNTITGTRETVKLYDSSFPVSDGDAYRYTRELIWLNRRIQETVSFDIYNFPHIFDFNDRIIFNGNVYFLQSNNFEQTPDIVYKQSLQIVRWY